MKRILLLSLTLVLAIAVGCSGKKDPSQATNEYYNALIAGKYDVAYGLLCKNDQSTVSKDVFVELQGAQKETESIKAFEIVSSKAVNDYNDPLGKTYKEAAVLKMKETVVDQSTKKDRTYDYERILVLEDGQWKIDRAEDATSYPKRLYAIYRSLAEQYKSGNGKPKDFKMAIQYYEKALQYEKKDYSLYFGIALSHLNLKQADEAIKWAAEGVKAVQDGEKQSELLNLKGVAYQMKGDTEKGIAAFKEALDLNPSNSYAADNLKLSQQP